MKTIFRVTFPGFSGLTGGFRRMGEKRCPSPKRRSPPMGGMEG